jgi:hypothetical protein
VRRREARGCVCALARRARARATARRAAGGDGARRAQVAGGACETEGCAPVVGESESMSQRTRWTPRAPARAPHRPARARRERRMHVNGVEARTKYMVCCCARFSAAHVSCGRARGGSGRRTLPISSTARACRRRSAPSVARRRLRRRTHSTIAAVERSLEAACQEAARGSHKRRERRR